MPGITPTFANDLFKLLFLGTPIANIADNTASSPITVLEFSLHTALPTTGQDHNEVTYTGYARAAKSRSGSAFDVTTNLLSWLSDITFPSVSAGIMSATYVGIGTAHTGAGKILFAMPMSPAISIFPGQVPRLKNTSFLSLG